MLQYLDEMGWVVGTQQGPFVNLVCPGTGDVMNIEKATGRLEIRVEVDIDSFVSGHYNVFNDRQSPDWVHVASLIGMENEFDVVRREICDLLQSLNQ